MENKKNNIIILWALGSPCNLSCKYCYFGIPENKILKSSVPDITTKEALNFIKDLSKLNIKRICIAGGEPLLNKNIFKILNALKNSGIQIAIATNGTLITDRVAFQIVQNNVAAALVSLDSYKADYHNKWRGGFNATIQGIKNLIIQKKKAKNKIKIGIYTVVTKKNIKDIIDTMDFVVDLGVDYYMAQPIWLPKNNPLYKQLSLTKKEAIVLKHVISEMQKRKDKIVIPNNKYLALFEKNFIEQKMHCTQDCFGGKTLFFIDPKGNIYDCPSTFKINKTEHPANIKKDRLSNLIFKTTQQKPLKCKLFSIDCLPMWELYYSKLFND